MNNHISLSGITNTPIFLSPFSHISSIDSISRFKSIKFVGIISWYVLSMLTDFWNLCVVDGVVVVCIGVSLIGGGVGGVVCLFTNDVRTILRCLFEDHVKGWKFC